MSDDLLLWGFGLMGAAFAIALLELFIPSGGIIAVTAAVVAIAGIVAFWKVSVWWGIIALVGSVVGAIALFQFALKIMPYTPIGRGLILGDQDGEQEGRRLAQERERHDSEQALVGATGVATTACRPVGIAEIEGARIEVLAAGGPIDSGTPIRVVSVEGNQVKVRPAD